MKFSLYFLGYAKPEDVPEDPGEGRVALLAVPRLSWLPRRREQLGC